MGATVRFCSLNPKRSWVALYILFFASVAIGAIVLALLPTPPFLIDLQPSTNKGLTLAAWALMSMLFGVLAGIGVDSIGYKRILAFGVIAALFGVGLQASAVALHPNPATSPLFWISSVLDSAFLAAVTVSAYSAVASFAGQQIGRKFGLALAVMATNLGYAVAGLLHAPFVKDAIAREITTDAPVVEHVGTVVVIVSGAASLCLAIFAVPFIKKNRELAIDAQIGLISAWHPFGWLAFWRFAAFAFMLIGAKSASAYVLYLAPTYLSRVSGVDYDAGMISAIFFAVSGLLAPLMQVAVTGANPMIIIPLGTSLASGGIFYMLLADPTIIGIWGAILAGATVAVGEALWWPRFLAYASDVSRGEHHTAVFLGLAQTTQYCGLTLAAVLSDVMIETHCPSPGNDCSVLTWVIPGVVAITQTVIGIVLMRFTFSPNVRSNWRKEVRDIPTDEEVARREEELANLHVTLEDSSSSDESRQRRLQRKYSEFQDYTDSPRNKSGVSLVSLEEEEVDDDGNPF